MHRLLKRQLKRHLGCEDCVPNELKDFVDAIDDAYRESDSDRAMLERSLDISSGELLQANSELSAVFQALPDLVFRLDLDGQVLDCKSGVDIDLYLPVKELIGKRIQDVPTKDVKCKFQSAIDCVKSTKSEVSIEYSLNMQGEQFYEARMLPLLDDQIIVVIRNVTEGKFAEAERTKLERQLRQSQKIEAIGTLAGGIAHDFNNLLGAILGYTELAMIKLGDNGPVRNDLERVCSAGIRARELVRQILDFSRNSVRKVTVTAIAEVVKEAVDSIKTSISNKIKVEEHYEDDCGAVFADPTEIHRIVVNLCSNAIQSMSSSSGTLSVDLDSVEVSSDFVSSHLEFKHKNYIRLTVRDTGCGMDKNTLERIYEPFFTTKAVGKGTGLGLSTVHGSVREIGGVLSVHSEPGIGTTFFVYFPHSKSSQQETKSESSTPRGNGERVLVVDDEELLVELCSSMLKRLGYEVKGFENPTEALNHFESAPEDFDIIVTDQRMPEMKGSELAAKVLQIRPEIPIILVTGFSEEVSPETASQLGFKDYLAKPYSLKDIGDSVKKLLESQTQTY